VGDSARAERIASQLEAPVLQRSSARGFLTYTGRFQGTEVTVISIGMGLSMMDFFVR
jgi:uridine phosphorylase